MIVKKWNSVVAPSMVPHRNLNGLRVLITMSVLVWEVMQFVSRPCSVGVATVLI